MSLIENPSSLTIKLLDLLIFNKRLSIANDIANSFTELYNNYNNIKEVISEIKDQLAGFKAPKEVKFIDQLPRNAMGKVQKNILRETFS